MGLALDLTLWIGDKLKADLRNYFRPDTPEEVAELIDELREDTSRKEYLVDVSDTWEDFDVQEEFDSNPVESIYELEDESGKMYVWKLPDSWSEEQRDNLFARLKNSYYEKFREEPQAAHLFLTELEELKEVSRDELKDMMGYAAKDLEV